MNYYFEHGCITNDGGDRRGKHLCENQVFTSQYILCLPYLQEVVTAFML